MLVRRVVWRSRSTVTGLAMNPHQPPFLLPSTSSSHSSRQASFASSSSRKRPGYKLLLGSVGSMACLATGLHYYTKTNRIYCSHQSADPPSSPLPPLTLYEYPSCPFCGKVRAFCDYHNIKYTAVSVNPVTRKEIQFSTSKKLPLIVVDGEKVSLQISRYFELFQISDPRLEPCGECPENKFGTRFERVRVPQVLPSCQHHHCQGREYHGA